MKKAYSVICAIMLMVVATMNAQPKTPAPVYSGPSAAGDMKRDKGDFTGAIADYTAEIAKIDVEANRIVKLKADYEKMSEFEKMNTNQDEVKKNYTDWAKLYYGRAMANIGLAKKAEAIPDLNMAIGLDNTNADAIYQRAMCTNSGDTKEAACVDMSRAASMGHEKAKIAFDDNFCWNTAMQHYKEGCSKLTVRKYQEALNEFDRAIALCPDFRPLLRKAWTGTCWLERMMLKLSKTLQKQLRNRLTAVMVGISLDFIISIKTSTRKHSIISAKHWRKIRRITMLTCIVLSAASV
jgi:tetratricopeptide (TPR) repeat protein